MYVITSASSVLKLHAKYFVSSKYIIGGISGSGQWIHSQLTIVHTYVRTYMYKLYIVVAHILKTTIHITCITNINMKVLICNVGGS